jgi:hypothetical protein
VLILEFDFVFLSGNFILYLPFNEIHDLGLLFLHHEIVTKGHHSVYLGRSLPIENLLELNRHFKKITYITYLTVEPNEDEIENLFSKFVMKSEWCAFQPNAEALEEKFLSTGVIDGPAVKMISTSLGAIGQVLKIILGACFKSTRDSFVFFIKA